METKAALQAVYPKSRRVWLGISDPASPHRVLDADAEEAIIAWQNLLASASFCVSLRAPEVLPLQATADAMATPHGVVLGGATFFNDGSVVWFQFRIALADARGLWP